MPVRPLPNDPSLEHLKTQAKALQRRVRDGDRDAIALVDEFHPRQAAPGVLTGFSRADAQLVLARRYGFGSWPRLVSHLGVVAEYSRRTGPAPELSAVPVEPADLADRFLRLACLNYTDDQAEYRDGARQMLAEHPDLATATIHTIAAVGQLDAARDLLARDPSHASVIGGPYDWEPLCYLAYSRINNENDDAVQVARLLLGAGADPDAGYLWRGMPSPFTVLTGAFGGGEQGQPPHPNSLALARLLLEAGADPNDNQALYNRMFSSSNDHLELLFEFGLGTDTRGPWRRRLGETIPSPTAMVAEQLRWAADHNMVERVRLLLDHRVDPDGAGYHPCYGTRTAYELARMAGNRTIAEMLAEAGATVIPLAPVDQLLAACMAGDRGTVDALVSGLPRLRAEAVERMPDVAVRATRTGRNDAVRLGLELGADVNAVACSGHGETALHAAAGDGHLAIARLLVRAGADLTARDSSFDSTPLGWAEHCEQPALVEYLQRCSEQDPVP